MIMPHGARFAFGLLAVSWLLGLLLPGCRSAEVSPKKELSTQPAPQAVAPLAPAGQEPAVTSLNTSGKPPEDWPSEVPLYPGAKIQMSLKLERGSTLTLETPDTSAQLIEYYKTQLASLPPSSLVDMGTNQTLLWSDPSKPLQVTLALRAAAGGGTRATLIVTREAQRKD
jgi:hypothetical protein